MRLAKWLVPSLACLSMANSPARADGQVTWASYLAGTRVSADAATFDAASTTYTFTIPAGKFYTFVTTDFVPLTLAQPSSGTNYATVGFTMSASGGFSTGTQGERRFFMGLFNTNGTAPGAAGNFTDDYGVWTNIRPHTTLASVTGEGFAALQPLSGGASTVPSNLLVNVNSPTQLAGTTVIRAGSNGGAGTLLDGQLIDARLRIAATTTGGLGLGTGVTSTTAGALYIDHATNSGDAANSTLYIGIKTNVSTTGTFTSSVTFDEFGFSFNNTTTSDVTFTLSALSLVGRPYFTPITGQPPTALLGTLGDSLSLGSSAVGTAIVCEWQKSTDNGVTFTAINSADNASAATATLTFGSLQAGDAGTYRVKIRNDAGEAISSACVVTTSSVPVAPSIQTQPQPATILVGGSTTLVVAASGTAPLTYKWQKSTDSGSSWNDIGGATTAIYTVASAQLSDAGLFRVVVTNGISSITSVAAALTVNSVPVISAQPTGASIAIGGSHTLSVTASGSPAPTYQWKRNGVDLAGATATNYSVASATGTHAGNYTVVVTNAAGSVTSAIAPVNVTSATLVTPVVTGKGPGNTLLPDSPLTLTFSAAVSAGLSGTIRIYDASNPSTPVDAIDFTSAAARTASASIAALPVKAKTIGGVTGFNYYPVTISGATVTIHPANGALVYGKTYYMLIDAGVFVDGTGASLAAVTSTSALTFTTKAAGPSGGTTTLTVAADGSGDFCTVQGAIDFVPAANTTPTTIAIRNGTYFEIICFSSKHNLALEGESRAQTIIEYPNNNTLNGASGVYHRGTVLANGVHDVVFSNLTIRNSTAQGGSQAEALIIKGSATTGQNIVKQVSLYSYQDTLQIDGQCYVVASYIEGDVDFMWGAGPCFFDSCEIRMKLRTGTPGYFSQIRNSAANHGYVFNHCRFTAEPGQTGTSLGRIDPRASGGFPFSEVVLLNTTFGDATNNAFLATTVGASGSDYRAGWWLLNGVTDPSAAADVRYWDYNSVDKDGAALTFANRPAFTIMPTDATTLANYANPVWVLNTTLAGAVNGTWTPSVAPIIVAQPAGVSVTIGTGASLSVRAAGMPNTFTYQWQKDGTNIGGATQPVYAIAAASTADVGSYTVVVSNGATSVTSAVASVALAPPIITTQPAGSQTVAAGTGVSFSVATVPETLTYQWRKDGVDIAGATGATLTLPHPRMADSGNYTVAITNGAGTVISSAGRLAVISSGGLAWQSYDQTGARISADAATFNPATNSYSFTIPANSTQTLVTSSFEPLVLSKPASGTNNLPVTFSMIASGGYGLNGSVAFAYTGFGLFNDGGTPAGAMGNFTDDKGLWIELYQSAGSVSMKPQSVTSAVPNCPVSLFKSDINTPYGMGTGTGGALGTINDNMLVDLTVRPSGLSTGVVQLGTNSSSVGTSGGVLVDHETNGAVLNRRVYSSASSGLSVASAGITFNVFGYHFQNSTNSEVTLQLSNFVGIVAAPYFTIQPPQASTVTVGDGLTLAAAVGGNPETFRWQYSASGVSFADLDVALNPSAATATLTLTSAQSSAAGVYRLVIVNAGGSATSVPTTVTVSATPFAPVIEVQPVGGTYVAGTAASLRVVGSGTAPLAFQWRKDGADVAGATGSTLSLPTTGIADAGVYTVTITNNQGSVTSSAATLSVTQFPIITTQPAGATVAAGAAVNLSVVASAAPAPTYQWKKNGVVIAGATGSTLSIGSTALSDVGNYTVVITNSAGSVTSSIAAINVLASGLSVSNRVPSAASANVFPDAPLTLTFNQPVAAGIAGKIRIYDASNPTAPVDTIDFTSPTMRAASAALLALPIQSKTIGTQAGFNYYPVMISGGTVTLYPRDLSLAYGKTYYVTIDAGALVDSTGATFAGFNDTTTWTFTTRAAPATAAAYTVAADGSGDFASVQGALDFIPANNTAATTITVKNGTYTEIVYWSGKNNLTIRGESRAGTVVGYPNNNTLNPSGTNWRAAFEGRNSTGTVLRDLTVKNFTPSGGSQAEALYFNNADTAQTIITNVNLISFQDTLNVNGPTYISDTYIEGDTDFMWGNGPVFFDHCELHMVTSGAWFTQVRNPATNHGFVYYDCLFSARDGVTGAFLGRLNQNTPAYSEMVLINCREDDDMLSPAAWELNGNTADQAAANTLCVEYDSVKQSDGLPVSLAGRATWSKTWTAGANATQIANYSSAYWVLNTQKDGTAKSTPTTWNPGLVPTIHVQPLGKAAAAGDTVSFTVNATGVPSALLYQWLKDGVAMAGATTSTLTLASATTGDAGSYTVTVTNAAGAVTSLAAPLTVASGAVAPAITTQPSSQTAIVGSGVSFTVVATGTAPLSYQWQKSGSAIAGATSATFALNNVQVGDAGIYTVTVTNSAGSVTSSPAVLSVGQQVVGGTYLGQFGSGGNWALYVRPDRSAVFIAHLLSRRSAVVLNLTVGVDGRFTTSGTEILQQGAGTVTGRSWSDSAIEARAAASVTLSGQITGDSVSGQLGGLGETFSGTVEPASGGASAVAGFYVASALGMGEGTTYMVIGASGRAVVVCSTPALITSGAGTVGSDGKLTLTTADNAQIVVTINPQSRRLAATILPSGAASPISFGGLLDSIPAATRIVNLSVRGDAGGGDRTLILGFVIAGAGSQDVLVRGIGPGLIPHGVPAAVALVNPYLRLFNTAGVQFDQNDDWGGTPALRTLFAALGAFAIADGSKDAALRTTLTRGPYTAHVTTTAPATGIAMVEAYDVALSGDARFANVSVRAEAKTGDGTLIAGFVLVGNSPKTLLIRGVGPSLVAQGVPAATVLLDPTLTLFRDGAAIATNDNWAGAATLKTMFRTVGAFSFDSDGSKDAALLVTVEPGVYTVHLTGANNTTGVALLELYETP